MDLGINEYLIEETNVAKWAIQFAGKDWQKIDSLLCRIVEWSRSV